MLKLASFDDALENLPYGRAWYIAKEHTIYIGFSPPRFILEILSHEALHQTLHENISNRASKGIDAILRIYGNILPRGGL